MEKVMSENLFLDEIRIDGGTQMREQINEDVVADYAALIRNEIKFPPVIVYFDGTNNWLADGFHRYFAHQAAGKEEINITLRNGTKREAILYAAKANSTHGLRRTIADKRKAVKRMLDDPEWSLWSDRAIALSCDVTHPFVAKIRAEVVTLPPQDEKKPEKIAKEPKEPKEITESSSQPAEKISHPENDFAPSAEELEANRLREQADRELLQKMLDSDDVMADLHAEVKRLSDLNASFQTRINVLMREKNEAIKMVMDLQKQLDKAKK